MKMVCNFNAGPAMLPAAVLEQVQAELRDYQGRGMSIMEMSHRSKEYGAINSQAETRFMQLLGVGDGYRAIFVQGGASTQFAMLPLNFLPEGGSADYLLTGAWAEKAYEEAAAGPRGHAPAPMAAWIRNPELARRAQKLGELIRYEIELTPRLREPAILVIARQWSAVHEWRVHEKEALKQGLTVEAISAIADGRAPAFENEPERLVYDFTISLVEARKVPDPLYRAGLAVLGEQGVVELVGVIGYYTFVSMTLAAFEIGMPGGPDR